MSRRFRFTIAAIAVLANMAVDIAGVTRLPDTMWALALVMGSGLLTLALIMLTTVDRHSAGKLR